MSTKQRSALRLLMVLLGACILLGSHAHYQHRVFAKQLNDAEALALPEELRKAFPYRYFGDFPGAAPNTLALQQRMAQFNHVHWTDGASNPHHLRVAVTRAGSVEIAELPSIPKRAQRIHREVRLGDQPVRFELLIFVPHKITPIGIVATIAFLLAGLVVTRFLPHPAPVNAYPVARDLSIIFDRKVSAEERWGSFRLTHLGGGGQLPGIADNSYNACNDSDLRLACLNDIKDAFTQVRPTLLHATKDVDLGCKLVSILDTGLEEGARLLSEHSPTIWDEFDVNEIFRPFVRDRVLSFALISCSDVDSLATISGLVPEAIQIRPPPAWLIGGYEIYYPRDLLIELIREIRSGLRSAFGATYDELHVFADPESAFVTFDFVANGFSLSPGDIDRIRQYLRKPFAGGLNRTLQRMCGFGRFSILDAREGFDITSRKYIAPISNVNVRVVNRLEFRRIRPEELEAIRTHFNRN